MSKAGSAVASLYFTYPHYPFRRPAEMTGAAARHKVAIVGGGPVGVTVALELARRGVDAVVLEASDTLATGSRAICFSRRTLEILDVLGVADKVMAKALPWTHGTSYYKNHEVFRLAMPHGAADKFPPMVNLQQCYLEQYLVDAAHGEPLIDLRWQSKLVGITAQPDGVTLRVETPEGEYDLNADYVVAADGARSAVRHGLGLKLNGQSYEGRYLIADIRYKSSYPTERRAWFDPPSNPGATILMHKEPDDIWRIDYQLRDEDDEQQELQEDRIRQRITAHLKYIGETAPWEMDWFSLYKAHSRCLDNYVHGRVIFAGDAAHLVPIFGVRGLNSGMADANNLGWKLAAVVKGEAPESLLQSYGQERRAATLDIFAQAGKSTVFMTPPSDGYAILREAALRLAVDHDFTRPLVNPRQSVPFFYHDSALNTADDPAFTGGPPPGALPPPVLLNDDTFLVDHIGRDVAVLSFADQPVTLPGITVINLPDAARPLFAAGPHSLYVLRPDGHVAARIYALPPHQQPAWVQAAVARAMGRESVS